MTKLYFEPISVECRGERPHSFIWRDHVHHVSTILKRWVVRVEWWRQEVSRRYYKVQCDDLGIYEIYEERSHWVLERLYD
jgi:hypothetical protein